MKGYDVPHPLSAQLAGKAALVTGAGRGIGRGIALVLAERGAAVCVSDLDAKACDAVAAEIVQAGGKAVAAAADVTDTPSLKHAAETAIKRLGKIDILVGNAGVIGARGFESRARYNEDDWDLTFNVNVKGLVHAADAVIPHMKERRSGRIVNISSQGGRAPRGVRLVASTITPYLVSKAAAIQFTHALAIELASYNITVNAVCPGLLWTPMFEKIAQQNIALDPALKGKSPAEAFDISVKARVPLGRPQTPEDVGRAVAFLASDDASEITGQALNVNGGAVMS
jgi:NAD(P)-dependent dehydrogenase (short-subunit alcohol dehydrogenase family)